MANLKSGGLQAWILVEAYKGGMARLDGTDPADKRGKGRIGAFFIHRHDVYRRYFELSDDSLLYGTSDRGLSPEDREARLKSAALLCESVKQLLKQGLIRFPDRRGAAAAPRRGPNFPAGAIHLTESGVRVAETLFAETHRFTSPDRLELYCPA